MTKKLSALFLTVLLLVAILYLFRVPLAISMANRWLADSETVIEQVEGLRLGWHQTTLQQLRLRIGSNQAMQVIEKVTVDYTFNDLRFVIEGLAVERAALSIPEFTESQPTLISELIGQAVTLPNGELEVGVLEMEMFPGPARLHILKQAREIRANMISAGYSADLQLIVHLNGEADLGLEVKRPRQSMLRLKVSLAPTGNKQYRLVGDLTSDLEQSVEWLEMLPLAIPPPTPQLSGPLSFGFAADLPDMLDQALAEGTDVQLTITEPLTVEFQDQQYGLEGSLQMELPTGASIRFHDQQGLNLVVRSSMLDFRLQENNNRLDVAGKISEIICRWQRQFDCQSGLAIEATLPYFELDGRTVNSMAFDLAGTLSLRPEKLSVVLFPSGHLEAKEVRVPDLVINQPKLIFTEPLQFKYGFTSEEVELGVKAFKVDAGVHATNPQWNAQFELTGTDANLDNFQLAALDINALVKDASHLDYRLSNMWLQGSITVKGKQIAIKGAVKSEAEQSLMAYHLAHDIEGGNGSARIETIDLDFGQTKLSQFFKDWPFNYNLVFGAVDFSSRVTWSQSDGKLMIRGDAEHNAAGLAGYYEDVVFTGLSSTAQIEITGQENLSGYGSGSLTLDTLEIGMPITDLAMNFAFALPANELKLSDFKAELAGGSINFNEFALSLEDKVSDRNPPLQLNIEAIDVAKLLEQADYQAVQAAGRISGTLPIKVANSEVSIEKGVLAAIPPGGIIRYDAEMGETAVNPTIKLVNEALSNYHYDQMRLLASYSPQGDLVLDVKMQGINPDMNNGQRINLNVNISDNIPLLLKSLQSSRVITDILNANLLKQ